jgi:hypothetical protein
LQTTLYELQGKGWVHVQEYFGGRDYVLMKLGWFEAQRISGYFEIPEGMERLSRLLAALKDAVKGRREKALVECEEIALAANLPEEWVRNMVESQALACLHPERSYWLSVDDGLIAVPPTFGQEIVEL